MIASVINMRNANSVPKATLQRYPVYLKALRKLQKNGVSKIMSKELRSLSILNRRPSAETFHFLGTLESRVMDMKSIS